MDREILQQENLTWAEPDMDINHGNIAISGSRWAGLDKGVCNAVAGGTKLCSLSLCVSRTDCPKNEDRWYLAVKIVIDVDGNVDGENARQECLQ